LGKGIGQGERHLFKERGGGGRTANPWVLGVIPTKQTGLIRRGKKRGGQPMRMLEKERVSGSVTLMREEDYSEKQEGVSIAQKRVACEGKTPQERHVAW